MSYMRFSTCTNLTADQKKNLVRELTECTVRALNLTPDQRNQCVVQFDIINPENIAIGGSMVSESRKACNHLEVMSPNLQQEQIDRLGRELTTVVAKQLSLTDEQVRQFGVQVMPINPNHMLIGGQPIAQITRR